MRFRGGAKAVPFPVMFALIAAAFGAVSCSREPVQTAASGAADAYVIRQLDSFAHAMADQVRDQKECARWRSSIMQAAEKWKTNAGSAGARYEIIQIREAAKAVDCVTSGS